MIREYDRHLPFHDYLTEGSHGRTGVYMTTQDCDVANEKVNQGWICETIDGGYWLRAPDISLVDITEPVRINQFGNPTETFTAFTILKGLLQQQCLPDYIQRVLYAHREEFQNFEFYVSEGEILEGEIRIGGNDARVRNLKNHILLSVRSSDQWQHTHEEAANFLGPLRGINIVSKSLADYSARSAAFIRLIDNIQRVYYPKSEHLGIHVIEHTVDQLPPHDISLFIPTGCFRYILSFIDDSTIDRMMLWEVHFDTNRPETKKIFTMDVQQKQCLIIDKTYTGKTLDRSADLVSSEGGLPIRLGLFPKGKLSVANSEYIMFLDTLLDSKTIDLSDKNWLINTFKAILSVKQAYEMRK